jgi:hypothetical protein
MAGNINLLLYFCCKNIRFETRHIFVQGAGGTFIGCECKHELPQEQQTLGYQATLNLNATLKLCDITSRLYYPAVHCDQNAIGEGCINTGCLVVLATTFCSVVPNVPWLLGCAVTDMLGPCHGSGG